MRGLLLGGLLEDIQRVRAHRGALRWAAASVVRTEGDETNPGLCGEVVTDVKGQAVHLIALNGDARVLLMSFVPGDNASLPFGPCIGETRNTKDNVGILESIKSNIPMNWSLNYKRSRDT